VIARDLVPAFVKLLKDNEAEVRTAIAGQIPGFCALVDRNTLLHEIMGTVENLVSDSSQHVRAALGTQISGLAPILGKQEYVSYFEEIRGSVWSLIICQDDRSLAAHVPPDAEGRVPRGSPAHHLEAGAGEPGYWH
jgi:hypothetical protein